MRLLGILNLTPDSFSDGGECLEPAAALRRARQLLAAGATILDLGAESTRPGAAPVTPGEEWRRLAPVLDLLRSELPGVPLSLDSRHPEVARRALQGGPLLLNDVTGLRDPAMLELAVAHRVDVLAMRSRMKEGRLHMPPYLGAGEEGIEQALTEMREIRDRLLAAGLDEARIHLDPGFGFGTTWQEDRAIWDALESLPSRIDWPRERICIAISRKRFTAHMADDPDMPPQSRDGISRTLQSHARDLGYRLFRVHAFPCFLDELP